MFGKITNANGIQDAGELGLPGVTVRLFDSLNNLQGTTTTNASGLYEFTNVQPGQYVVEFEALPGYLFSPEDAGSDDELDSDANQSTGRSGTISLTSGLSNDSIDAGMYQLGNLEGFIWDDSNFDGVQDAGELAVSGITVNLYDSINALVSSDTTDASGLYSFTGLIPNDYVIEVVAPTGFVFTHKDNAGDDLTDSDVNLSTGRTDSIPLLSGETQNFWDAGLVSSSNLATVGDFVWNDLNNNGVQDLTETGVEGLTVELFTTGDQLIASTLTDASGNYLFSNILPGNYYIEFSPAAGFIFTDKDIGLDEQLDSDPNAMTGRTDTITLSAGQTDLSWDAGLRQVGTVGNFIWKDLNFDGLQQGNEPGVAGVTVHLLDQTLSIIDTTVTDGSGFYSFPDLNPDLYAIEVVLPSNFLFTHQDIGSDNTADSDINQSTGQSDVFSVGPGQNFDELDGGIYQQGLISDLVFEDQNFNGIQDAGESGLAGVTVNLLDQSMNVLLSTVTDGSGLYSFSNLNPGNYIVEVVPLSGYSFSPQDMGVNDAIDSDVDSSGKTSLIQLQSGEEDTSQDAGMALLSHVGDLVFEDSNFNGLLDPGELGVDGVVVHLLDASDNQIASTTTDANGNYSFNNLVPGDYRVEFVSPSGFAFTHKDQGTDDTIDSDPNQATGITDLFTLTPGQTNNAIDAGIVAEANLASLGDFVWSDSNFNGLFDAGELGVSNVTVKSLRWIQRLYHKYCNKCFWKLYFLIT